MVALSVSISAITSPVLIGSPSFLSHLARLPFSIVGDSAGMRMLMGMIDAQRFLRLPAAGADFFAAFFGALPGALFAVLRSAGGDAFFAGFFVSACFAGLSSTIG